MTLSDVTPERRILGPLDPQLKLASVKPTPELLRPTENEYPHCKPATGGYWTSTYLGPEKLSGWAEWCRTEDYSTGLHHAWLLHPKSTTRVYSIDTLDDLTALCDRYPHVDRYHHNGKEYRHVDWEAASRDYDGVHLTDDGQWATRLSFPLNLYGWDCESTLWFRWVFERVDDLGPVILEARPYVDDEDGDDEP